MKKKILFSVLVLAVFAMAVFIPNTISAAAPAQYKIVSVRANQAETLANDVLAELNDGWSLLGGPFSYSSSYNMIGQALVK
jgi:hypothetical protein